MRRQATPSRPACWGAPTHNNLSEIENKFTCGRVEWSEWGGPSWREVAGAQEVVCAASICPEKSCPLVVACA